MSFYGRLANLANPVDGCGIASLAWREQNGGRLSLQRLLSPQIVPEPRRPATLTVRHQDLDRNSFVHPPAGSAPAGGWPVVLAFHGGGVDAENMAGFCGLHELGERAGFVTVYPSGTGRLEKSLTWNAGSCCGHALSQQIDDVGFVRKLLDALPTIAPIDFSRVYVSGMSNGGMLAYRLAAEMAERLAAVASVAGPLCLSSIQPALPMPVLHFHGTDDEFTPFTGGRGIKSISQTDFLSVADSLGAWIAANQCPATPEVAAEEEAADGTSIERRVYGPGREGVEVTLYIIHGGGHTWPGRQPRHEYLGRSTASLSASDILWAFFQRWRR